MLLPYITHITFWANSVFIILIYGLMKKLDFISAKCSLPETIDIRSGELVEFIANLSCSSCIDNLSDLINDNFMLVIDVRIVYIHANLIELKFSGSRLDGDVFFVIQFVRFLLKT